VGPNIMLPSIRLIIGATFATVVVAMSGFWFVTTFQIAKTSIGVPLHGPPLSAADSCTPIRNFLRFAMGRPHGNGAGV
jgi:hypothetical protein